MITQIQNPYMTKAVGAGVQNKGILDSPKGEWHNWINELYTFYKKVIHMLDMKLSSKRLKYKLSSSLSNHISSKNNYFDESHKFFLGEKNNSFNKPI